MGPQHLLLRASATRFQDSEMPTYPPNTKTSPTQNPRLLKSRQNCFRRRSKKSCGPTPGVSPVACFRFIRAGGTKHFGGGVGAPKQFRGPPNLGGQYRTARKTCQEGIAEKSQNVRGKSQRVSICSGCVAKWPQRAIQWKRWLVPLRSECVHLAFPSTHLMV
jgi:hypothetical protein